MAKDKKKNKKQKISIPKHPAILFLNWVINGCVKPLGLAENRNIIEDLDQIHIEGKENRSPHMYITAQEVVEYYKKHSSYRALASISEGQLRTLAIQTVIAVGWRQYMQVFAFDLRLLDDIFNIDINDEKNAALDADIIEHIPCFNFFVEFPITLNNVMYDGFFVFFNPYSSGDVNNQELIHVMFIKNSGDYNEKACCYEQMDMFAARLVFDNLHDVNIIDESNDRIIHASVSSSSLLKMVNQIVYEQLGENEAVAFLAKLNNIITYLCASNADFKKERPIKKKPDSKRTHFSDAEFEKWSLGKTMYDTLYRERYVPANYLNYGANTGAYERLVRVDDPNDDAICIEAEPTEDDKPRAKHPSGYHVRPHMRRAHTRTYWYGKKDGSEERYKAVKYIPSVFINATGEDIEIPTRNEYTYPRWN